MCIGMHTVPLRILSGQTIVVRCFWLIAKFVPTTRTLGEQFKRLLTAVGLQPAGAESTGSDNTKDSTKKTQRIHEVYDLYTVTL